MLSEFHKEIVLELLKEADIIRIQQNEALDDPRCDKEKIRKSSDYAWERLNALVRLLIED